MGMSGNNYYIRRSLIKPPSEKLLVKNCQKARG